MATESEINQHFEHAMDTMANFYHAANRDGSVPGIAREAIKDVRNTIHEFFFGKSERGGEPGAPLNPLFHDIVEDRKSHEDALGPGPQAAEPPQNPLPSPGEIAGDNGTASPEQQPGNVHGRAGGGLQGPEHGVYGPEKGVYGRDSGQAAGAGAAGSLPTPGEIADDKGLVEPPQDRGNVHGQESAKASGQEVSGRDGAASGYLPTPGEIADDQGQDGRLGQGIEVAEDKSPPKPGSFLEKLANQRQNNQGGNTGQDELARGKVLSDDQLEHNKGRDR